MSIKQMARLFYRADLDLNELAVALALADFADDNGGNVRPSMRTLARKVRSSRSNVQRIVRRLEAIGYVKVIGNLTGGAPGDTRRLTLHPEVFDVPGESDTRTGDIDDTPTGSNPATGGESATGSNPALDGSQPCTGRVATLHRTGSNPATQSVKNHHRTVIEPRESTKRERLQSSPDGSRSRKPTKSTIPADFEISDAVQKWAAQRGIDPRPHLEAFRLKCAAKGYQYADWDAAFKVAIRDDWAGSQKQRRGDEAAQRRADRDETIATLTGRRAATDRQPGIVIDADTGVIDADQSTPRIGGLNDLWR